MSGGHTAHAYVQIVQAVFLRLAMYIISQFKKIGLILMTRGELGFRTFKSY